MRKEDEGIYAIGKSAGFTTAVHSSYVPRERMVYLAGPMTGIEEHNYPAFFEAEERWVEAGWYVLNPARNFPDTVKGSLAWDDYLRVSLRQVSMAGALAMLPGWEHSRGAVLEHSVGVALDEAIYDAISMEPLAALEAEDESVLQEAHRLVHGARQADYGHPIEDFTRTGRLWGALLADWAEAVAGEGWHAVPPELVALCMVAVKQSREINAPKRDNRVDGAGYFGTLELVRERQGLA